MVVSVRLNHGWACRTLWCGVCVRLHTVREITLGSLGDLRDRFPASSTVRLIVRRKSLFGLKWWVSVLDHTDMNVSAQVGKFIGYRVRFEPPVSVRIPAMSALDEAALLDFTEELARQLHGDRRALTYRVL